MSEEVKEAIMQFETAINFKTATIMPMEYSIDIENAKVLLKYIEQLQQEHNALIEFEKWLIDLQKYAESKQTYTISQKFEKKHLVDLLNNILKKLQELKEGNNEKNND